MGDKKTKLALILFVLAGLLVANIQPAQASFFSSTTSFFNKIIQGVQKVSVELSKIFASDRLNKLNFENPVIKRTETTPPITSSTICFSKGGCPETTTTTTLPLTTTTLSTPTTTEIQTLATTSTIPPTTVTLPTTTTTLKLNCVPESVCSRSFLGICIFPPGILCTTTPTTTTIITLPSTTTTSLSTTTITLPSTTTLPPTTTTLRLTTTTLPPTTTTISTTTTTLPPTTTQTTTTTLAPTTTTLPPTTTTLPSATVTINGRVTDNSNNAINGVQIYDNTRTQSLLPQKSTLANIFDPIFSLFKFIQLKLNLGRAEGSNLKIGETNGNGEIVFTDEFINFLKNNVIGSVSASNGNRTITIQGQASSIPTIVARYEKDSTRQTKTITVGSNGTMDFSVKMEVSVTTTTITTTPSAVPLLSLQLLFTHPEAAAQPTADGKIIHTLHDFDGKIFSGYGDYGVNTGPIAIRSYNPLTKNSRVEYVMRTEQIARYVNVGDRLYAAAIDPGAGGNSVVPGGDVEYAYRKLGSSAWVGGNNTTSAFAHVFDIASLDGQGIWLFGSVEPGDAAAIHSPDGGATWDPKENSANLYLPGATAEIQFWNRLYFGGTLNGKIYTQSGFYSKSRVFDPATNVWTEGPNLLPSYGSSDSSGSRPLEFAGKMVYITAYNKMLAFDGSRVSEPLLPISEWYDTVTDLQNYRGYLYVLAAGKKDYALIRTADLRTWEAVGAITTTASPNKPYSFRILDNIIYVGMSNAQILSVPMPTTFIPLTATTTTTLPPTTTTTQAPQTTVLSVKVWMAPNQNAGAEAYRPNGLPLNDHIESSFAHFDYWSNTEAQLKASRGGFGMYAAEIGHTNSAFFEKLKQEKIPLSVETPSWTQCAPANDITSAELYGSTTPVDLFTTLHHITGADGRMDPRGHGWFVSKDGKDMVPDEIAMDHRPFGLIDNMDLFKLAAATGTWEQRKDAARTVRCNLGGKTFAEKLNSVMDDYVTYAKAMKAKWGAAVRFSFHWNANPGIEWIDEACLDQNHAQGEQYTDKNVLVYLQKPCYNAVDYAGQVIDKLKATGIEPHAVYLDTDWVYYTPYTAELLKRFKSMLVGKGVKFGIDIVDQCDSRRADYFSCYIAPRGVGLYEATSADAPNIQHQNSLLNVVDYLKRQGIYTAGDSNTILRVQSWDIKPIEKGEQIRETNPGSFAETTQKVIAAMASGLGTPSTNIITIRARGTPAVGQYPIMELRQGNSTLQSWVVAGDYRDYSYTINSNLGSTNLRVYFTNDYFDGREDRNLIVDYISVNGRTYQSEDVYEQGYWSPSTGCASGHFKSETIYCNNGYFEYPTGQSSFFGSDIFGQIIKPILQFFKLK